MNKQENKSVLTPDEKKEKIIQFAKAYLALVQEIEPFRDSLKDLKRSYKENNWLDKNEIKYVINSLRLIKNHDDIEKLSEIYDKLKKEFGF